MQRYSYSVIIWIFYSILLVVYAHWSLRFESQIDFELISNLHPWTSRPIGLIVIPGPRTAVNVDLGGVARMQAELKISDIHSLPRDQAFEILTQISRVEKKTFPANEAFGFGEELWRKKPNTRVLYATRATPGATSSVIAYAVYVRQKGVALLHKVCVVESYRRQGVGMQLMEYIRCRLQKEGCQYIQLWVDKARDPARSLYIRTGFEEREVIPDYYAPGRTGIKMVLDLDA